MPTEPRVYGCAWVIHDLPRGASVDGLGCRNAAGADGWCPEHPGGALQPRIGQRASCPACHCAAKSVVEVEGVAEMTCGVCALAFTVERSAGGAYTTRLKVGP